MKNRMLTLFVLLLLLAFSTACAESTRFTAGTFTGSAVGFHGELLVEVEVSDQEILKVTVGENNETYHVGEAAFPILEKSIVENQSLADVITGATITSRAVTNAVIDALKKANASDDTLKSLKVAEIAQTVYTDTETDIVIVGAGIAGMVAAMQAKEVTDNVILLEKNTLVGGSGRLSAGGMMLVGAEEFTDSVYTAEDVHRWFSVQAGPVTNDPVFYEVMNRSKDMLSYIKENGYTVTDVAKCQSKLAPIFRNVNTDHYGMGLSDTLESAVAKKNIDLRCNTTVTALLQNENGVVEGVVANNAAGSYTIRAKKVILATGGFSHNKEMLNEYAPFWNGAFIIAASGADGDGHQMGPQAGGHIVGNGAMQIYVTNYDPSLIGNMPGNIPLFVGTDGNQICASDEYYGTIAPKIQALDDKTAYAIFSSDNTYYQFDYYGTGRAMKVSDMDTLVEEGRLVKADTLEELAVKIGIDPAALQRSVNEHNWFYDLQINDAWGTAAAKLQPIKTGPYYAGRQVACVMGTIPGLEINTAMQVVNANGQPIENLYAAGELVFGNVFNRQYPMAGTGIGIAMSTGYLAGQNAANALN